MALGLWLHLTEDHEDAHVQETLEHSHALAHDAQHQHAHASDDPPGEPAHPLALPRAADALTRALPGHSPPALARIATVRHHRAVSAWLRRGGLTSTRSIRRTSMSTTSKRRPFHSNASATCGT